MTAEKIRRTSSEVGDRVVKDADNVYQQTVAALVYGVQFLAEIAAQLAEMNERAK